ncbi:hypothetical protein BDQ12DRAFT_716350 [Crucibulum laeve]|uniref:Protein kinase domain-containing protein n=1 Tax=Crucibulum laeve TaxID=68775 RepID=A0A5C3LJV2_9AGAR|nr:hypothetical protein BDQ12DRAFT_716350 [Crucibulum laeve]
MRVRDAVFVLKEVDAVGAMLALKEEVEAVGAMLTLMEEVGGGGCHARVEGGGGGGGCQDRIKGGGGGGCHTRVEGGGDGRGGGRSLSIPHNKASLHPSPPPPTPPSPSMRVWHPRLVSFNTSMAHTTPTTSSFNASMAHTAPTYHPHHLLQREGGTHRPTFPFNTSVVPTAPTPSFNASMAPTTSTSSINASVASTAPTTFNTSAVSPTLVSFNSGTTLHFKYVRALENDARCITYQAKIQSSVDSPDINASTDNDAPADNDAPTDIVVKFVARYGKDVHEFLARENHAPALRYFGAPLAQDKKNILGDDDQPSTIAPNPLSPEQPSLALPLCPMKMVVMDYVSPHAKPWPQDTREQIIKVLNKLHNRGYVFGDLRPPNVLFDQSNEVKFIDFDWSGLYKPSPLDKTLQADSDYTYYPLNLSKSIIWVDGADDLLPILPEHDLEMLHNLPFGE